MGEDAKKMFKDYNQKPLNKHLEHIFHNVKKIKSQCELDGINNKIVEDEEADNSNKRKKFKSMQLQESRIRMHSNQVVTTKNQKKK